MNPESLEQFLPQLHRELRVVPAQHFFAHLGLHRGELPQEIVAIPGFA